LDWIEIPGEHEARERAWTVVSAAFAEREPTTPKRSWKPFAALAAALAVVAGLASPPGNAVFDDIREAVGVEKAQPALFSLPAPGRLLVTSAAGPWVVQRDGSRRLLGSYAGATWSPYGRFVLASRRNELVAMEPAGRTRWSLARARLGATDWGGTPVDTRIAYAHGDRINVIGGDGRGDRFLLSAPDVPKAPIAWAPRSVRLLAHSNQGILRLLDVAAGGDEIWSVRVAQPFALFWTSDGERLVAVSRNTLTVLDARGQLIFRHELAGRAASAAVNPRTHTIAVGLRVRGTDRSEVFTFSLDRKSAAQQRLFGGVGTFGDLAWSPNGRWLLVAWKDADQWVFVRSHRTPRIDAVANVSDQFGGTFPRIEGWCCAG